MTNGEIFLPAKSSIVTLRETMPTIDCECHHRDGSLNAGGRRRRVLGSQGCQAHATAAALARRAIVLKHGMASAGKAR